VFQIGLPSEEDEVTYNKWQIGQIQPSAWTSYPDHYKFISFAIYLSSDKEITNRMTPGFLDYIGDVGGLNEIIFGVFAFFLT
jgi:hypothetical protein